MAGERMMGTGRASGNRFVKRQPHKRVTNPQSHVSYRAHTMEVNELKHDTRGLVLTGQPIVFRPNVAAILQNSDNKIFVAERLNIKGAWQFPQGGIDDGEDAETALYRELAEEIGVTAAMVKVKERRDGYRYAFPKGRLKYGIYGGQEQAYFLCQYLGRDEDVDLAATHQEFARWRWIAPEEFQMSWVPKFKRAVYRQVFKDFFGIEFQES
jgi:putative (di)nucleoside polyphosphate hydrolase